MMSENPRGEMGESVDPMYVGFMVQQLRWMIRLRWIAVGAFFSVALLHWILLPAPSLLTFLALAFTVVGYNTIALITLKRWQARPFVRFENFYSVFANLQAALDSFIITVGLHFGGGVENPIYAAYIILLIVHTSVLSKRMAYGQAAWSTFHFTAMALGEMGGLFQHWPGPLLAPGLYQRGGTSGGPSS